VYEVATIIRQRTDTATANGVSVSLIAAIAFSLVLSSFGMSITRLLNSHVPASGRSSNAAINSHLEPLENGPVTNFHPWAALPAFPARTEANGEIRGKVIFEGTLPKYKPLDMINEPTCAKHYTTPQLPENVVAGPDNGLKNVVVYISAGIQEDSPPTQAAILKQWGCRYMPHVLALETNQEIWVQNEDSVAHTVHPMARINKEVNRSQPPGTPPFVIKFDKPEVIRVKCELHPWMRGIFVVLTNSHYSVSDESGSFSLPDLPPGKYTIKAWHEQFGEHSQVVSIGGGEVKELNFTFKATP
jgi:hypothetical protein